MQPQNKTTNTGERLLLTATFGYMVYPVALALATTLATRIAIAIQSDPNTVFRLGSYVRSMIIDIGAITDAYGLLLVGPAVGLLIGLFITFRQPKSLWHAAAGGALIGFVVGIIHPLFADAIIIGSSTLAGMLSALAMGLAVRYVQNTAEHNRGSLLFTTIFSSLVHPVAFVLAMLFVPFIVVLVLGGSMSWAIWVPSTLIGTLGVYGLPVGPVIGLLIWLFIEFRQTGSLWHAARRGAFIGFVIGLPLAVIAVGIMMRQQVETAPLPGGVFIILANTLAALLTALAVGLAMRRLR